jgi:hypothetical protein
MQIDSYSDMSLTDSSPSGTDSKIELWSVVFIVMIYFLSRLLQVIQNKFVAVYKQRRAIILIR